MAFFDIQNFVESTRNMKTGGIAIGEFLAAVELFAGEPHAVRESILHLVAVLPDFFTSESRSNLGQLHHGYACEGIVHLPVLALKLETVMQVLPAATTAYAEVGACRNTTHTGRFHYPFDFTYGIAAALLFNLHIHDIAWRRERYEHHHFAMASYGISFGGYAGDFQFGNQRKRFAFTSHHERAFRLAASDSILAVASACLRRSASTTAAGALDTKRSLDSFFSTLARNPLR